MQNLIMASGQRIKPGETLIIFDEIQECNKALNSLKYFCENAPEYHLAYAGSLLGVALSKPSTFPVGKVDFLDVDPMTFTEFLMANGDGNLAEYMNSIEAIEPIPGAFFNPLCEKLKMYFVTGGCRSLCVHGCRIGTLAWCSRRCPISSAHMSEILPSIPIRRNSRACR